MTPLEPAPPGLAPGRDIRLKREDVHELGAFKWRGALPVLERFRKQGASTVVTASTGNQGAATAWAAQRLGLGAVIFTPLSTSRAKLALLEQLEANVRLTGSDFDEAKDEGVRFADEHGFAFFGDGAEAVQYEAYRSIGEEILSGVALLEGEGLRVVRSHHERWDGLGYPSGLAGERIPLGARIFALADALDAMTSDRPYRSALSWEEATDEILSQDGSQFDPKVVRAFCTRERQLRRTYEELSVVAA